MQYREPIRCGELLRQLTIIRPDGSIDHNTVVMLSRMDYQLDVLNT